MYAHTCESTENANMNTDGCTTFSRQKKYFYYTVVCPYELCYRVAHACLYQESPLCCLDDELILILLFSSGVRTSQCALLN